MLFIMHFFLVLHFNNWFRCHISLYNFIFLFHDFPLGGRKGFSLLFVALYLFFFYENSIRDNKMFPRRMVYTFILVIPLNYTFRPQIIIKIRKTRFENPHLLHRFGNVYNDSFNFPR